VTGDARTLGLLERLAVIHQVLAGDADTLTERAEAVMRRYWPERGTHA